MFDDDHDFDQFPPIEGNPDNVGCLNWIVLIVLFAALIYYFC